ncbi:hypothetical protein [uncultured Ruminococcus sp.]|uniref:hypothetical protein n=1 Tax=uncultured Ruminococcus sp. TaxID=165186 RepID=UPI0025FB11DD|nr:hypothetical protein [uncultured Ruminococcus sp.]
MMNNNDVQEIFETIAPGTTMTLDEVYDYVEDHSVLTADDLAPYTETRDTVFPHWKSCIQTVLSYYKARGYVDHDVKTYDRTFFPKGRTKRDDDAAKIFSLL